MNKNDITKQLTIVIPTYNRKERLLRQLESLHRQGQTDAYWLIIIDNGSDYDLEDTLKEHEFDGSFFSIIQVIRRPLNTKMGYNLAATLLFPKTKWIWTVSDDDISTPNSIETVLSYTKGNATLVKFQFTYHRSFNDISIKSVHELEELYAKQFFTPGDLFYLGNNLINRERLQEYLSDAFEHSSHLIPFILPALHQLTDGKAEIVFSDKHVQTYVSNKSGDKWIGIPTILKFAELFDIQWNNYQNTCKIFRIVCNHFMVSEVIRMLLKEKDRFYRRYAYRRLRRTVFARPQTMKEHLFWYAYFVEEYLRIPVLSTIHPLLKRNGF